MQIQFPASFIIKQKVKGNDIIGFNIFLSFLMEFLPPQKRVNSGLTILLCSDTPLISSGVGTVFLYIKVKLKEACRPTNSEALLALKAKLKHGLRS